jgi:NDP-sugar pyrophosphorylase family protein
MNLAIIGTDNRTGSREELKSSKQMMKIKGEYLVERIIRIGRDKGIKNVFCIVNTHESELKHYLSTNKFGIPVTLIVQETENSLHSLFVMAPFLIKEPFFLVSMDMIFTENEFAEFIAYSMLQEDVDGVLAVTRYNDNENPLCLAMDDHDIIFKFSNSKEGYSWAVGGIYYFSPIIFNEMEHAIQAGISSLSKALQLLIAKRYVLKGFSFSKIIKVDHADDIAKAENLIIENY